MENAIIIRTDKQFEEKALNDAVKGLAKAFTNIDKNRRDACLIMWRLEDGKKFEKDGFKSLQEFAETIGIDKSSAHRMADAGRPMVLFHQGRLENRQRLGRNQRRLVSFQCRRHHVDGLG